MGLLNALLLLATALTIPGEPCSTEVPGTIVTTPCNMLMERLGPWYVSPLKSIELYFVYYLYAKSTDSPVMIMSECYMLI